MVKLPPNEGGEAWPWDDADPADVPFITGYLTGKDERPLRRRIEVTAAAVANDSDARKRTVPVGSAKTDDIGYFVIPVSDAHAIEELADEQRGIVTFVVTGNVPGATARASLTRRVIGRGDTLRLVGPSESTTGRDADGHVIGPAEIDLLSTSADVVPASAPAPSAPAQSSGLSDAELAAAGGLGGAVLASAAFFWRRRRTA